MHAFLIAAVIVTGIAAVTDWRTWQISNWLTFGTLLCAPIAHALVGFHTRGSAGAAWGLGYSIAGAMACGLVPLLLFVTGGMFGGDVKLLAALGALLAPMLGLEAEFYAFLAAALFALGRMAYEGKLLRTLANTAFLALNPFLPKAKRRRIAPEMMTKMRFGPAAFVGTCAAALLDWSVT